MKCPLELLSFHNYVGQSRNNLSLQNSVAKMTVVYFTFYFIQQQIQTCPLCTNKTYLQQKMGQKRGRQARVALVPLLANFIIALPALP